MPTNAVSPEFPPATIAVPLPALPLPATNDPRVVTREVPASNDPLKDEDAASPPDPSKSLDEDTAAVRIQARVRGSRTRARKDLLRQNKSALQIQSAYRGRQARKKVKFLKAWQQSCLSQIGPIMELYQPTTLSPVHLVTHLATHLVTLVPTPPVLTPADPAPLAGGPPADDPVVDEDGDGSTGAASTVAESSTPIEQTLPSISRPAGIPGTFPPVDFVTSVVPPFLSRTDPPVATPVSPVPRTPLVSSTDVHDEPPDPAAPVPAAPSVQAGAVLMWGLPVGGGRTATTDAAPFLDPVAVPPVDPGSNPGDHAASAADPALSSADPLPGTASPLTVAESITPIEQTLPSISRPPTPPVLTPADSVPLAGGPDDPVVDEDADASTLTGAAAESSTPLCADVAAAVRSCASRSTHPSHSRAALQDAEAILQAHPVGNSLFFQGTFCAETHDQSRTTKKSRE